MTRGLVYHHGGLGDFVLSVPAVLRVAAARRAERWHFWGPADRLALLPGFLPPPSELVRAGHTLWGASPDPGVVGFLAGCEAVLAFGGRSPPPWPGLPESAKPLLVAAFPEGSRRRVPAHHARQLDALGVPRLPGPCLPAWRRAVLPDRAPEAIVLHPGSGDARKNLPAGAWSEVLAALAKALGAPTRVVLGPVESERGGAAAWPGATVCGSAEEILAALSRARLFLGNDAGATHLSALLGVPTVAVFGPSDPALWRPLGPAVRVVRTAAPCAPCTRGEPFACERADCLEAVDPGEVVRAALSLAGRVARGAEGRN